MKNQFNIEVLTAKKITDVKIEAETAQKALAAKFGGSEGDYYQCSNITDTGTLYCTESNGVYEMFAKKGGK